MAIVREHCAPGTRRNPDGRFPEQAWPDDCLVQWGGRGIVFAGAEVRETAFFEAFPTDPETFIRGEGATVAEAEADAFARFVRQRDCSGHQMERAGYRNGCGRCTLCGLFLSHVFEPLEEPDTSGLVGQALAGDLTAATYVVSSAIEHDVLDRD